MQGVNEVIWEAGAQQDGRAVTALHASVKNCSDRTPHIRLTLASSLTVGFTVAVACPEGALSATED